LPASHPHVTAVVVTYNRRALVTRVLDALRAQTRPVDRIVVIDNGSTDGTRPELEARAARGELMLIEASDNLGGAGGFERGCAWSLELGTDWVWLMDDDAIPDLDCLELLLGAAAQLDRPSFVAPHVVDETGGTGPRNYPELNTDFAVQYRMAPLGLIAVAATTFVGPLLSAEAMRRTHLPLGDFFIWHDDVEYTARLHAFGPAAMVPTAKIAHLAGNPGPAHYNGARNLYNVRNYLWWYREVGRNRSFNRNRIVLALTRSLRAQFRNAPNKLGYLAVVARAAARGLFTRPAHRTVADVLRRSRAVDRVVGAPEG
jgi:GT2 family glycosyltransferase